jgi:hypothetical protein
MTGVLQSLDNMPKPFLILCMVAGFILFWPIGLAVLGYMLWSRRMGCASNRHFSGERGWGGQSRWEAKSQRFMEKMNTKMERWGQRQSPVFQSTGNAAFDEYREETLRRLEDEAGEFHAFMSRLRMARDKAEFDQYMADRKAANTSEPPRPAEDTGSN